MRAKIIIPAAMLAVAVLAPAIYFQLAPSSSAPAEQAAPAPAQVAAAAAPAASPKKEAHLRTIAPSNPEGVALQDTTGMDREDIINTRTAELTQLGASDNPADLKVILSELNNKEPVIRKSALDAAVQFGSKDAIPALQNEMQWAEDPQEKVDIQNAINFLQLPSFDELQNSAATAGTQAGGDSPPAN